MILNILTQNSSQTKKVANCLAKEILSSRSERKGALILGLVGDLGGGKTTFLQGFAKGLGIKEKILSPTFVIMKKFKLPIRVDLCSHPRRFAHFYHIDCYRAQSPKDLLTLGFKEIASDPQNIVAIEWADKIRKTLPKNTIWIKFGFVSKNKRKIALNITYPIPLKSFSQV